MLVLTRKLQEKIQIGDNITITILRTKGKSVRLGIEAPLEVPVVRGELSFDREVKEASVDSELADAPLALASSAGGRVGAEPAREVSRWESKGHAHRIAGVLPGHGAVGVTLQRVPRERVSELHGALPTSGGGPLRAMLDRRPLTA
jgi:carbon storage regulator CsrA